MFRKAVPTRGAAISKAKWKQLGKNLLEKCRQIQSPPALSDSQLLENAAEKMYDQFPVSVIREGYLGQSTCFSARLPSEAQLQFCLMRVFLKALGT